MVGGSDMLLKDLSEAFGVSGNEREVRELIKDQLKKKDIKFWTDNMGNLIAHKPKEGKKKLMMVAHMDEIGLMITGFEKNGAMRIKPIGCLDFRVLVSKTVCIGDKRIPGIIGSKAIHLLEPGESKLALNIKQLYIDIGTSSKDESERIIKLGDVVAFDTKFKEIGQCYSGKALDDRVGCSILLELLNEDYPYDLFFAFTVQEEVGLRGAAVAAYTIEPDFAIVVECTTASDVPGCKEYKHSSTLNKGPVISIMDLSAIGDRDMTELFISMAEKHSIPYQFRRTINGGTDAGRIHLVRGGIPSSVISVLCRYIHSPTGMLSKKDYEYTKQLINVVIKSEQLSEIGLRRMGNEGNHNGIM